MVDPKELRIGNYVLFRQQNKQIVRPVTADDIFRLDTKGGYGAEPITISPNVLTAAGFTKVLDDKADGFIFSIVDSNYLGHRVKLIDNTYTSVYISLETCLYSKVIKDLNLHTLQNLYFLLTGEELEIKL